MIEEKKYDENIEKKKEDWRKVTDSILTNMFRVETDIRRIYIDLNSCMSIVFRTNDITDEDLNEIIYKKMENFLSKYLSLGADIIVLYTQKPSEWHRNIYPDWCKGRDERVQLRKSDAIKQLLIGLKAFSEKNTSVKIINTGKLHPVITVLNNEDFKKTSKKIRKVLILSKDCVFQCMNRPYITVWNGMDLMDQADENRVLPDEISLSDPGTLLPWYLAYCGDHRNEFKGVFGYGPVKSLKHVTSEALLVTIEDPKTDEDKLASKYHQLYDVDAMYEFYYPKPKVIKNGHESQPNVGS